MQAAAVLGCLLHQPRVLAAACAAGGGASLLPVLAARGCKLALTGALYLLSCLAEFPAARAELEAAGGVAALLSLLRASTDVAVQARPAASRFGCRVLEVELDEEWGFGRAQDARAELEASDGVAARPALCARQHWRVCAGARRSIVSV